MRAGISSSDVDDSTSISLIASIRSSSVKSMLLIEDEIFGNGDVVSLVLIECG